MFLPFPLLQICAVGAGLGLLSHWAFFIRGEHHNYSHIYFWLAITVPAVIFAVQYRYLDVGLESAAATTAILVSTFWQSLWTSIIVYRLFFHRLRKFPGPSLAKVSKIYQTYLVIQKNNFELAQELHDKYGPFVRVGPAELSILHPDAVRTLLGARSRCSKAPWYDMGLPQKSLHTARDKGVHDKRRRVWDQGFSAKALQDFESRQKAHSYTLATQISRRLDQPVNVSKWFNYYSFDVMGDLAFGKSFGMLDKGEDDYALKAIHEGQILLGNVTPIPWIVPILKNIPFFPDAELKFREWRKAQIEERKRMTFKNPDLMSWLLEESEKSQDQKTNDHWLLGDAQLIVVAGSDTTAATLTYIFYHLARLPGEVARLRAELEPLMPDVTDFDYQAIKDAPHLNGVINEALRLHPPVPSGVLRLTPPEGIQVGETFIPGDITVSAPFHPLGYMESIYPRAREFIPERWYSNESLLLSKDSFAPFSTGRYGCIGKNLALMELRTVVALIVLQFDVQFAPGEDGEALLNKSKDSFTMFIKDLNLIFSKREST